MLICCKFPDPEALMGRRHRSRPDTKLEQQLLDQTDKAARASSNASRELKHGSNKTRPLFDLLKNMALLSVAAIVITLWAVWRFLEGLYYSLI